MKFEILLGPEDGEIKEINKEKVLIGRLPEECDIIFPYDTKVSRKHAKVILKENLFRIEDLCSSHGTKVGEKHLYPKKGSEKEAEIRSGDILIFGRTWVRFLG